MKKKYGVFWMLGLALVGGILIGLGLSAETAPNWQGTMAGSTGWTRIQNPDSGADCELNLPGKNWAIPAPDFRDLGMPLQ